MSATSASEPTKSIDRPELYWIFGAVIFGAFVRLNFPGRMAVEHFDEGVYASNFWFGGQAYPFQYLYAPPLLPTLIDWTMMAASLSGFKPTGFIPMIPSLVAGIATIPSIWWICRRWFGPTVGLASSWLVATSDFHAGYSRTALTDVTVCLFILWAVYFIERSLQACCAVTAPVEERGKSKQRARWKLPWRNIVLAGVFTGFAWWTKYNGWLPLAIGIAGGAFWQLLTKGSERRIIAALTCISLIVIIAASVWSPVIWGLQKDKIGGYAAVAANHRQYLVGATGWPHSAWVQMNNIGFYENPFEIFYAPFPHLNILDRTNRLDFEAFKTNFGTGNWGQKLGLLHAFMFEDILPLFIPILFFTLSLWVSVRNILVRRQPTQLLASCLMAAWFAGLTIATPFYHPYPRLNLPWLCSTWICVGLCLTPSSSQPDDRTASATHKRRLRILVVTLVTALSIRLTCGSAHAWQDRSRMQAAAGSCAKLIRAELSLRGISEDKSVTVVLGQPAIVFGLKAEGLRNVHPLPNLDFVQRATPGTTFVVIPESFIQTMSDQDRDRLPERFRFLAEPIFRTSHLVINDAWNAPWASEHLRLAVLIK